MVRCAARNASTVLELLFEAHLVHPSDAQHQRERGMYLEKGGPSESSRAVAYNYIDKTEHVPNQTKLASSASSPATTSPLKVGDPEASCPLLSTVNPLVDVGPALISDILVVDVAVGLALHVRSIGHDELAALAEIRHPPPDGLGMDARALPDGTAVRQLLHAMAYPVGINL